MKKYSYELQYLYNETNDFYINDSYDDIGELNHESNNIINLLFTDDKYSTPIVFNFSQVSRSSLFNMFSSSGFKYRLKSINPIKNKFYISSDDGENIFSITQYEKDVISIYNNNDYSILHKSDIEIFSIDDYNTLLSKLIYLKSKYNNDDYIDPDDISDVYDLIKDYIDKDCLKFKLISMTFNKIMSDILNKYKMDNVDLRM